MKYPVISIAIATYNSEKTLEKVLLSIQKQNYPKAKVETLIIDGGSTDSTLDIARKFRTKIVNNPKVDFVHAKKMGYDLAKGKYLILLDSDEEIVNKNSLRLKLKVMNSNDRIIAVVSSGYRSPSNYPKINAYVNEYGDPFSFYMYKSSRDHMFFLKEFQGRYKVVGQNRDSVIFDFSSLQDAPFLELISMGVMINLEHIRKMFPKILKELSTHNHLFYLINSENNYIAITKNDSIIHYSVPSFKRYFKKLSSRVKNNIFGTGMGIAGFTGREQFYSLRFKLKKLLFIPYSFSLVFPIIDSFFLAFKHKKSIYLIHFLLCIYVSVSIIYFYILKALGGKTNLIGYAK